MLLYVICAFLCFLLMFLKCLNHCLSFYNHVCIVISPCSHFTIVNFILYVITVGCTSFCVVDFKYILSYLSMAAALVTNINSPWKPLLSMQFHLDVCVCFGLLCFWCQVCADTEITDLAPQPHPPPPPRCFNVHLRQIPF